jgi:hypothetical protein
MSMKRTVPGGRVDTIYTQNQNKKEVIATIVTPVDDIDEELEEVESEEVESEEKTDNQK